MDHKKFRFKSGLTKQKEVEASPPPPPPVQSNVAALIEQLVSQKLAALVQPSTLPVLDKDFALIEESLAPVKEVPKQEEKPKLPRLISKEKPELKSKKLVIEASDKRAEFEQVVSEFNKDRSLQNEAKKRVDEARKTIIDTMQGNLIYDGDSLAVNIKEISNQSVDASKVVEALIDMNSSNLEEIKAGVQQIIDLARLGVMEFSKTNFERWVKGHGYDPKPFIIEHEKEKRIYITPK